VASGRNAFEQAVARYRLPEREIPARALSVAAASLERTGLFLLGEVHGVAQTPQAILGLVARLGVRALAFEWAHDELDDVVQPVLSSGTVASDELWRLPSSAEVFSGDGRFTAGHVRLLEHLGSRLDRILLLDRVGWEGPSRAQGMAARLLAGRSENSPMVAVLGVSHVARIRPVGHEAVGLLVERELPGVANGILKPTWGRVWFHGEQPLSSGELPPADVVIPLGVAHPAVVPQHPDSGDARRA
jgi:hypothetical protein